MLLSGNRRCGNIFSHPRRQCCIAVQRCKSNHPDFIIPSGMLHLRQMKNTKTSMFSNAACGSLMAGIRNAVGQFTDHPVRTMDPSTIYPQIHLSYQNHPKSSASSVPAGTTGEGSILPQTTMPISSARITSEKTSTRKTLTVVAL